jgi:hypothetical protein
MAWEIAAEIGKLVLGDPGTRVKLAFESGIDEDKVFYEVTLERQLP